MNSASKKLTLQELLMDEGKKEKLLSLEMEIELEQVKRELHGYKRIIKNFLNNKEKLIKDLETLRINANNIKLSADELKAILNRIEHQ